MSVRCRKWIIDFTTIYGIGTCKVWCYLRGRQRISNVKFLYYYSEKKDKKVYVDWKLIRKKLIDKINSIKNYDKSEHLTLAMILQFFLLVRKSENLVNGFERHMTQRFKDGKIVHKLNFPLHFYAIHTFDSLKYFREVGISVLKFMSVPLPPPPPWLRLHYECWRRVYTLYREEREGQWQFH